MKVSLCGEWLTHCLPFPGAAAMATARRFPARPEVARSGSCNHGARADGRTDGLLTMVRLIMRSVCLSLVIVRSNWCSTWVGCDVLLCGPEIARPLGRAVVEVIDLWLLAAVPRRRRSDAPKLLNRHSSAWSHHFEGCHSKDLVVKKLSLST